MTCLSELCAWFQRQQAAIRLETTVTLLQMLHPLELRFVGTCVEEFGRLDHPVLREIENQINNDVQFVAQCSDLTNAVSRSRLIVAMSLLKTCKYATASALYRILISLSSVFHQLPKTKEVLQEMLLLLAMAKIHPAFKFSHRDALTELIDKVNVLVEEYESQSPQSDSVENKSIIQQLTAGSSNCFTPQTNAESEEKVKCDRSAQTDSECTVTYCNSCSSSTPTPNHSLSAFEAQLTSAATPYIINVTVRGNSNVANVSSYHLQVTWSNGDVTEVTKSLQEMYDFHKQLLDWYPKDAGAYGSGRKIPYFPGTLSRGRGYNQTDRGDRDRTAAMKIGNFRESFQDVTREVYDYIKDLMKLSPDILRSNFTVAFFKTPSATLDAQQNTQIPPYTAQISEQEPPVLLNNATSQIAGDGGGSSEEADCLDETGRMKSFTIYNSHVPFETRGKHRNSMSSSSNRPARPQSSSNNKKPNNKPSMNSTTARQHKLPSPSQAKTDDSVGKDRFRQLQLGEPETAMISSTNSDNSAKKPSLIPHQLYTILKKENLTDEYKRFLSPRDLDELSRLTEADITLAGLPKEACMAVINAVKRATSMNRPNGVVASKGRVIESSNDPGHSQFSTGIITSKSDLGNTGNDTSSLGADDKSYAVSEGLACVDSETGNVNAATASEELTKGYCAPGSEEVSDFETQCFPQDKAAGRIVGVVGGSSTCGQHHEAPYWSESDFPPIPRSCSDACEAASSAAAILNMANSYTSSSLPPSKSQSPAPIDSVPPFAPTPPMSRRHVSQSSTFPPYQPCRNGKQIILRTPILPLSSYKSVPPPLPLQRGFDYSHHPILSLLPTVSTGQIQPGQAAGAALPAASFVQGGPGVQRLRLLCQCSGGNSGGVCCHNWAAASTGSGTYLWPTCAISAPTTPAQIFSPSFIPQGAQSAGGQFFPVANVCVQPTAPLLRTTSACNASPDASALAGVCLLYDDSQEMLSSTPRCVPHSCSNCGSGAHKADMCSEPTLEDVTSAGRYHLDMASAKEVSSTQGR